MTHYRVGLAIIILVLWGYVGLCAFSLSLSGCFNDHALSARKSTASPPKPVNILCTSGTLVLWIAPHQIIDPSFSLSYAALKV